MARIEAGAEIAPFAEATVIAFAGVGLGPISVGLSGELLLFHLSIPIKAFAEGIQSADDDGRETPPLFLGAGHAFAAGEPQEYDWDLGWGMGAGANLRMLDGTINLEARVKVGPFKKRFKKKLAEWSGPEKEFIFVSSGRRVGDNGEVEFPEDAASAELGTFRSEYYFVDPAFLYTATIPLDSGELCEAPQLGPCEIVQ